MCPCVPTRQLEDASDILVKLLHSNKSGKGGAVAAAAGEGAGAEGMMATDSNTHNHNNNNGASASAAPSYSTAFPPAAAGASVYPHPGRSPMGPVPMSVAPAAPAMPMGPPPSAWNSQQFMNSFKPTDMVAPAAAHWGPPAASMPPSRGFTTTCSAAPGAGAIDSKMTVHV